MNFKELNLHPALLKAVERNGYETTTPIQAQAIPYLLENRDMLGSAQTGTGKTAAFALPIIHHIHESKSKHPKHPQALILAPTRELALQIKESFETYSRMKPLKLVVVYGGVSKRNQIMKLKKGADVIIATPGRLLDLMNMKLIHLDYVKHLVLDEGDQMLDMGFIDDVNKIIKAVPANRQTMLFSATIPEDIRLLAKRILTDPIRLEITPQTTPLETVNQSVLFVKHTDKIELLKEKLATDEVSSGLVFVRTKNGCNRIAKQLNHLDINIGVLHGDKTQRQRQDTLNAFKQGNIKILIATDVAARGIDINALSHVINYDMPQTPQTYLHRIGRTARAGKLGAAMSFCAPDETHLLKAIQSHINMVIAVDAKHSYAITQKPQRSMKPQRSGKPQTSQRAQFSQNTQESQRPQKSQKRHSSRKSTAGKPAQATYYKSRKKPEKNSYRTIAYNHS